MNFDSSLYKYLFTSDQNFTISYDVQNSINNVIGVSTREDQSSSSLILYSNNSVNFINPSIVYCCIEGLNNIKINCKNLFNNISFIIPITSAKT